MIHGCQVVWLGIFQFGQDLALIFGKPSAIHHVSVPVQIVEVVGRYEMDQSVKWEFIPRICTLRGNICCYLKNATWRFSGDLTGPLIEKPAHSRSLSQSRTASSGDHVVLNAGCCRYSFRPGGTTRPEKNLAPAWAMAQKKNGNNRTSVLPICLDNMLLPPGLVRFKLYRMPARGAAIAGLTMATCLQLKLFLNISTFSSCMTMSTW